MIEAPNHNEDLRSYLREGILWRDEIAALGLPILLEAALKHETISYTELANVLKVRFQQPVKFRKQLYGQPLGKIGYALQELGRRWRTEIPPLTALVVRQDTQQPGYGAEYFVEQYLSRISSSAERVQADPSFVFDQIYNFSEWRRIADHFQVRLLTSARKSRVRPPIQLPKIVSSPYGIESSAHIELKTWAANNPRFFALFGDFKRGKNEQVIQSGDRLDVLFANEETCLAIEVKASNANIDEVTRGVFQCVKYRAVLQATQFAEGRVPNGQAALLHQCSLSEKVALLAERLKIKTFRDPRSTRVQS
jgi:hypothetical protein